MTSIDASLLDLWEAADLWVAPADQPPLLLRAAAGPGTWPIGVVAVVSFVTGWNPGGLQQEQTANEEANRHLAAALDAEGLRHWPAAGASRDRSWVELGFALPDATRVQVCRLGARFGQLALYEWTPGALAIVACDTEMVLRRYGWSVRPGDLVAPLAAQR